MSVYRSIAVQAAKKAGLYLAKHHRKLKKKDIHLKSKHEIVTKADIEANDIILKTIKRKFPNHDYLSEETGLENNPGTYQWVIDPLDGTTNYSIGNPLFCVAISLLCNHEPLVSVTFAPVLNEFYIAEKGKGATLNGKKIRVSPEKRSSHSIVSVGYSRDYRSRVRIAKSLRYLWKSFLNTRVFGSGCLSLAYMAAGRIEGCYLAPPSNLWDIIAGVLLIREAGGQVTDLDGKQWNYKSKSLIASNGKIHKHLIRTIKL
ncbi:inositol monophosphatase family protein [Patescibacteria group bacterium]